MNLGRNVKISSCQTRDNETEIESASDGSITDKQSTEKEKMNQKDLDAGRCSVWVKSTRIHDINHMNIDTARRSVETIE